MTTASAQVVSLPGCDDGFGAVCQVRLTVPRRDRWRAWGVSGEFERRLAEQESPAIAVRVGSWVWRGRDYLQVVIAAAVDAADRG